MSDNTSDLLGYKVYNGGADYLASVAEGVINTINPHCYIVALKDKTYREALYESDYIIPDGVGIQIASFILSGKNIHKIAGSDLHSAILKSLGKKGGSCFYLGSSQNTLNKIRERLSTEYPGIKCGFFSPPYKDTFSPEENGRMISIINEFRPDILFVGMTAPKQEKWVYQNRDSMNVPVICSIGAVFDFYAGTVKRPGKFWISLGLEWLPRLLREPRRLWKRNFISNPLFILYVIREKIKIIPATIRLKR
jgi:N-acetylglucosaminyldiphosphoundecaprenol N-acetyl-beta-D-mannosaminyltransferase